MRIELTTDIRAPRDVCFDLARNIDVHVQAMAHTGERAVSGRTSGLISLGEEVTWSGRHFGILQHHTSRITAFERPSHFRDTMIAGRFKAFEHDHIFETIDGGTRMRDVLVFESPFGLLGRVVDRLFLARHLRTLLGKHNEYIRAVAERWS